MQFRILGPFEVVHDGCAVDLPRGRIRVVLALLALHAHQVVPAHRLIEAVWDGHEPPTARTQVQGFISQLRRRLAPLGGDQPIATRGSGYVLDVGADALDLDLFRQRVAAAREARRRGDQDVAAGRYAEALRLWRGRVFEGTGPSRLLEAEAVQLDRLRREVVQEHARSQLDAGQHARVAAELPPVAEEYPLDEGLWEVLMLALHRSGRRDEALLAYQRIRGALVEQLGVEPGQVLRRLQQQILEADPALEPHVPPAAAPVTPGQLPPDLMDFTGRRQEVAELIDRMSSSTAVAIASVTGAPGVGKTSLAVHVAHRVWEDFPDGQLYVDLRGTGGQARTAQDVLARFLRDLGTEGRAVPADEEERAARYRSLLAERRVLVVLDNARDAAQVRPLLPGSPSCAVLVTSRGSLAGLPGHRIALDAMAGDHALDLLTRIVGSGRLTAESQAAARLVDLCAGLPLALRIAGARLASRPVWRVQDLVHRLARATSRLDELTVDDLTVRASLAVSYDNLPGAPGGYAPARTFRLLGLWPGAPLTVPAVAALLDTSPRTAGQVLEVLLDAHLVQAGSPDRYGFHDLLRVYAAERAAAEETDDVRDAAVLRLVFWYLQTVSNADRLLTPGRRPVPSTRSVPPITPLEFADRDEALRWTVEELPNLLAAVDLAADRGYHDIAWKLSFVLFTILSLQGRWGDRITAQRTGLASARRVEDRHGQACLLNGLKEALDYRQQAPAIFRQLGDRYQEATCLSDIGHCLARLGKQQDAREHWRAALELMG